MSLTRALLIVSGFYHSRKTLAFSVDLGFLPPCSALTEKPCRPHDHLQDAFLRRPLFQ